MVRADDLVRLPYICIVSDFSENMILAPDFSAHNLKTGEADQNTKLKEVKTDRPFVSGAVNRRQNLVGHFYMDTLS